MWVQWNSFKSASIYLGVSYQDIFGNRSYHYDANERFSWKKILLIADTFHNSIALPMQAVINEMYVCVTLRTDCQGNQKGVVKAMLKKGEMIQRNKDGISGTKWKDKHDVLMISNKDSVEMVDVTNRRGQFKSKPNVIQD